MSRIGSLTTAFTPPPHCTSSFSNVYVSVSGDVQLQIAGPVNTNDGCFPNDYQAGRGNFYSPGICPVGYGHAFSSLVTAGSVTETVVTCCPTSFDNTEGNDGWPPTMGCRSAFNSLSTKMTFISGRQTTTTVTSWTGGALNAYSIQVRFQNTDFQNTTLSSPTTTLMVSTRSTATPTATDQNNASANGGLGKGAIAGIVVGGILGLGVIIGITYFLTRHFLLHKTAKDAEKPGKQANVATFENKMTHELPMNHTGHTVSELGADTVARQI